MEGYLKEHGVWMPGDNIQGRPWDVLSGGAVAWYALRPWAPALAPKIKIKQEEGDT